MKSKLSKTCGYDFFNEKEEGLLAPLKTEEPTPNSSPRAQNDSIEPEPPKLNEIEHEDSKKETQTEEPKTPKTETQKNQDKEKLLLVFNGIIRPKHANIPLLYGVYESRQAFYVMLEHYEYSLDTLLKFNKHILERDITRKFVFYQTLQVGLLQLFTNCKVVFFCHKSGFAHGKIKPSNILVNDMLWVHMTGLNILYAPHSSKSSNETCNSFCSISVLIMIRFEEVESKNTNLSIIKRNT